MAGHTNHVTRTDEFSMGQGTQQKAAAGSDYSFSKLTKATCEVRDPVPKEEARSL